MKICLTILFIKFELGITTRQWGIIHDVHALYSFANTTYTVPLMPDYKIKLL